MSKFKTPEEALEAISKAADEVETLMKSWQGGMAKDEGEMPESDEIQDTAAADQSETPEAPEAADEGSQEDQSSEAPEADQPSEEPQGDDQRTEMEQHASQLSDEELATMLEILSNEMEKRHADEGSQEDQSAPEAAPAPAPAELERSMKSEFAKLSKSFSEEIEKLKKSVSSLKTENESLKKKIALPRAKPVSSNARGVEKTPSQVEKLNKSETVDFLLGEMRKGNRNVNSDMVALANAVRQDDELEYVHSQIKNAGVDLPVKK